MLNFPLVLKHWHVVGWSQSWFTWSLFPPKSGGPNKARPGGFWDFFQIYLNLIRLLGNTMSKSSGVVHILCQPKSGGLALPMQNSVLSKQSAAVNTICLILTIKVDGELGKVKGIKSYLQWVEGAGPEVIQYILYYNIVYTWPIPHSQGDSDRRFLKGFLSYNPELLPSRRWTMNALPSLCHSSQSHQGKFPAKNIRQEFFWPLVLCFVYLTDMV